MRFYRAEDFHIRAAEFQIGADHPVHNLLCCTPLWCGLDWLGAQVGPVLVHKDQMGQLFVVPNGALNSGNWIKILKNQWFAELARVLQ